MIKGQNKTEKEYRAINMDSYSSLKDFSMSRRAYYKKYVLGEKLEDEDSKYSLLGKVVETLLFEKEKFDDYFYIPSVEPPSAMMLDFVNALLKYTRLCTDPDTGDLTKEFAELTVLAHADSGYKISLERVMKDFSEKGAEIYYMEAKNASERNLSPVGMNLVSVGETIASNLRINSFLGDIINQETDEDHIVFNQLKVQGYSVNNHKLKSMLDKVIFHIPTKKAYIYDLKCTWSVENFYESYYLKRRSYIQGLLYKVALEHVISTTESLKGYIVQNPSFIVCDSDGFNGPILYKMSNKDLHDAWIGFWKGDKYYPGTKEIIDSLKWNVENNLWHYSKETFEKNAVMDLCSKRQ